ncbi:MAG: AAA family ATPase [Nitrospirales bacterium]
MYCKFYGLQQKPFHVTPDLDFLYLSPGHKQALGTVLYGVKEKKGVIVVTGEMGMGKTTLLQAFLHRIDSTKNRIIRLLNPNVSFKELLKTVLGEFDHGPLTGDETALISQLQTILLEESRNDRTVILLIDEAQALPLATLEHLRLLSNLETSKDKLLQIVLVAQPELHTLFSRRELPSLQQRIAVCATIFPLSPKESLAYIHHRLTQAGCSRKKVFTNRALTLIVREAKGIPRKMNIICDNALVTGFGYKKVPVTRGIVKEVIADLHGMRPRPSRWWVPATAGMCIILLAIAVMVSLDGQDVRKKISFSLQNAFTAQEVEKEKLGLRNYGGQATKPRQGEPLLLAAGRLSGAPFPDSSERDQEGREDQTPRPYSNFETRVVREGDTLVKLVREAYGSAGPQEVEMVLAANPQLISANKIFPDQEVMFPFR